MSTSKYEKIMNAILALCFTVTAAGSVAVYLITHNTTAAVICAVAGLLMCAAVWLVSFFSDRYVIGIVSDLSRLTDILINIEERHLEEIFPGSEDTVVSKLQSKVLKLATILKKRSETELSEKENIKSMVSDISHQLKTPIANLIMYSQFLDNETLDEQQRREYVKIIRTAVDRLNFLSESMIKISRLESGIISLNIKEQSLNETSLRAIKNIYAKAKQKGTKIIYSEQSQLILPHDRSWTAEAIFNLLDNAVKYSKEGAKIYLELKCFGSFCAVSVRDENEPIPEEDRSKVFQRFYRGSNSIDTEGVGIGLYLSRVIAIRQGGYMTLRATDSGNEFQFVIKGT